MKQIFRLDSAETYKKVLKIKESKNDLKVIFGCHWE